MENHVSIHSDRLDFRLLESIGSTTNSTCLVGTVDPVHDPWYDLDFITQLPQVLAD